MPAVVVVFVVWFLAVLVVGAAVIVLVPRFRAGARLSVGSAAVRDVADVTVSRLGRPAAAVLTWLGGAAATVVVCWLCGRLAHALQGDVDWPVFRWWASRRNAGWSDIWTVLTNIGKPRITQAFAAAGAVFFAVVWAVRRLRWWAPLLVFPAGYALEKYAQIILQDVVHRGHPPTTLGTFPSGGCARVLIVYGLVIFFALRWWSPSSRRPWAFGGTVLALLVSVQAYARIYNLEHWVTDVVGGIIFGLMGLAVMIATYVVLDRDLPTSSHREQAGERLRPMVVERAVEQAHHGV